MSMLEQRIQQQFFESADLQYQSADTLARPLAEAAAALVAALTAGARLWVVGHGPGRALAQHVAQVFTTRFERERPPLAALALGNGGGEPLAQIQALGLPGDVLLLLDDGVTEPLALIRAAQDKDMTLVVIAGRGAAAAAEWLGETDVLVTLPTERAARQTELQLLALHCLCDAVDYQLLGELEP